MYRRFAGHIRFPAMYHVYLAHVLWFLCVILLIVALVQGWEMRSVNILLMVALGSFVYAGLGIWFSVKNRQEVVEKARKAGFKPTD